MKCYAWYTLSNIIGRKRTASHRSMDGLPYTAHSADPGWQFASHIQPIIMIRVNATIVHKTWVICDIGIIFHCHLYNTVALSLSDCSKWSVMHTATSNYNVHHQALFANRATCVIYMHRYISRMDLSRGTRSFKIKQIINVGENILVFN